MHRIDTPDAVAGAFNDNPAIQSPTTRVTGAWANDVQENLALAIEGAGIALDKGAGGQLLAAIKALARLNGVPVGAVMKIDGPAAPVGYLALDGEEYDRDDFPALVEFYSGQGRLIEGTTPDTFKVPDYTGRFDRAWSHDAVTDPDGPRAPGSLQADDNKSHNHSLPVSADDSTGNGYVEDAVGTGPFRTAVTSTQGTEARPKNVALLWCVKT